MNTRISPTITSAHGMRLHSFRQVLWVCQYLTLGLLLGLAPAAHAVSTNSDPSSRVARISYLKGRVFVQPAALDAWTEARINRPLTSGDRLATEDHSRSELQIGNATLQIDADTQVRLLELSDNVLQVEVTQGVVNVHARSLARDEIVEVDTPNAAIALLDVGTYRIDVAADQALTLIQVRNGSAEVANERQSFNLREGEQLRLQGSTRLSATYDDVERLDDFDRWARDRNERSVRSSSTRYVSSGVIGYEDLDDHGYWRWYPSYGYVWLPSRIAAGWAPYRYGHWLWISPWGWTWIDDAPWGFAPFHYGRWVEISHRWCWVPGPRSTRAVYAPALVAWVGTPGLNISVNLGNHPVGWIPLGPREVYRPYYPVSNTYVVNINLNNSLLTRAEFDRGYKRKPHEVNYGNRGATSVVNAGSLSSARPVNNNLVRDTNRLQALETMPVTRPDSAALLGGERRTTPQLNSREVLARRQPQPAPNNAPGAAVNSTVTTTNPATRNPVRVITPTPNTSHDNSVSGRSYQARPVTGETSTGKLGSVGGNTGARDDAPVMGNDRSLRVQESDRSSSGNNAPRSPGGQDRQSSLSPSTRLSPPVERNETRETPTPRTQTQQNAAPEAVPTPVQSTTTPQRVESRTTSPRNPRRNERENSME